MQSPSRAWFSSNLTRAHQQLVVRVHLGAVLYLFDSRFGRHTRYHVVQAAFTSPAGWLLRRHHSCSRPFQGHRQRSVWFVVPISAR